jgi:hypothetical protein
MSVMESPKATSLVTRVQNILMKPAAEWDVIAGESATIPGLYTGYACILAAIPALASIVGAMLISHMAVIAAVIIAVITYVASLISVFVMAFIIDALAPNFGAEKNLVQAMKLTTYSYTASWVAGILNIIPFLGIIAGLAGLYGLYIMYLGLPKLMKSPADKTTGYFVVSLVVAIVVNIVIGAVIGAITAALIFSAAATGAAALGAYH